MKRAATTLAALVGALSVLAVPGADALAIEPPAPPSSADACATTWSGRRLACVSATRSDDGTTQASVCTYDDALGIFGWSRDAEVACVEVGERWGFVPGPAVCVHTLGAERPTSCVNGEAGCTLWAAGVRILCHAS